MKNTIIFFALLLSFQYTQAQDFRENLKYTFTEEIADKEDAHAGENIFLVRTDNTDEKLASFTIEDPELFENVFITTLEQPGLEGIQEVVKVDIEYIACCAHVETYYYMVTEENDLISLPKLENVYCEDSNTDLEYIFPNQEYGITNNILKTEILYNETGEVRYVNLKQSFAWNDDNYGTTEIAAHTKF